jgi:hypothetical protein
MPETDNTATTNTTTTNTPAPAPLAEGYQAIKGYQPPNLERGYQALPIVPPSQPPQGGSVIAAPNQGTGTSSQAATAPQAAGTPPQGGNVIAPSTP